MAEALQDLFTDCPEVDLSSFSSGLVGAIGNTPLISIDSLSSLTGCRILAKAEFCNPGGSIKDRAALRIVAEAEALGKLVPRSKLSAGEQPYTLVEGTGGNTGIGLAMLAASRGYACHVFAPANCSAEKVAAAERLGAKVFFFFQDTCTRTNTQLFV